MTEEWRPVLGWEGLYEVSDQGRVRSVDRIVRNRPGVTLTIRGQVLKPRVSKGGYLVVWLYNDGARREQPTSRLVCAAWHGPCPPDMECRHLDDDKTNNTPENLCWGTRSENTYDKIRNGRHPMAAKTHCKRGHAFDEVNTYRNPATGSRRCRKCKRLRRIELTAAAAHQQAA